MKNSLIDLFPFGLIAAVFVLAGAYWWAWLLLAAFALAGSWPQRRAQRDVLDDRALRP